MKLTLKIVALCGLLAVSGCKVGPNYHVPAAASAPTYSEDGHNGDWKPANPADGSVRADWWTVYRDSNLNDLEQRCAAANQNIAAALHTYEQAHALVLENRANLYPTVTLGGFANRNRLSSNRALLPSNQAKYYWDFLIPLNISWEPDLWGAIRRQIESASANAQASAADLANTRLSLQGLLATTYLQIRGIDLQVQLLQNTIQAYTQTLQLTQDRFRGGLATEIDVDQAQAQLEGTRAQLVDIEVQREQYEHAIAVLVGQAASGFHIAVEPLAGDPPGIPAGIPSELLERRPDIAAAERRVAAANAQIGVAKAAYYPTIDLGAEGGTESDVVSRVFAAQSTEWNAGPSASEILFDAGRRKAQVAYAVAQRDQATALYRQQVLSAFRDVEDQLSALRVLEQESRATAEAVNASRKSTDLSTLRYKRGVAAYLEVLTNQTIELENERAAAALVARRIVASAQLQIALGGGWTTRELPAN
jgi:NodT family efflux transporter outer membrane factor (OMF) lipoprotein